MYLNNDLNFDEIALIAVQTRQYSSLVQPTEIIIIVEGALRADYWPTPSRKSRTEPS